MAELELRHLRVVVTVANAGSVSRAAAKLGISQPALTAQLQRIERMLGGPLFDRGRHGVTTTPLGQFVLHRAEALLGDMRLLVREAREISGGAPDELRIGSMPLLLVGGFVDRLRALGRWQDVVSFIEPSHETLVQLLTTGRVDAAVLEEPSGDWIDLPSDVTVRILVTEPVYVAVADWHRAAERSAIELSELAGFDWVAPPPPENAGRRQFLQACAVAGFAPRVRHYTSDTATARALVSEGCVSLASAVSRSGGGLVVRPLVGDPLHNDLLFVTRSENAGEVQTLLDCAARSYVALLDRNPDFRRWWDANPQAHRTIDAVLPAGGAS